MQNLSFHDADVIKADNVLDKVIAIWIGRCMDLKIQIIDCYAYTTKYSYMIKTEITVRCRLE
jgi:hypothetical protein